MGKTASRGAAEVQTIDVTPRDEPPPIPPPNPDPPKPGEKRQVIEWAVDAGHVPPKATDLAFRGEIHTGPHYRVVIVHAQSHKLPCFAVNAMVTKDEYEAGVRAAYSIEVRENWSADETVKAEAAEEN